MKQKKAIAMILAATLVLGLAGCGAAGNDGGSGNSGTAGGSDEEKVLRVGMEGTYAPYTYHDDNDKLTGFEVDVANAIGEKMGYKVEFVETEWDSIFEALKANNFDVIMNQVTITDERLETYDFSTPYVYSKPVLIVKADNTDITSFDDIAGKKAAEGLTSNFNQIAQSYGAEIIGQDKFALAMECVLSGEADLTINDELTYAYWKTLKKDTASKIVAESDDVAASAVITKKGNDELLEKINKAIEELLADGTIAKISEKYFSIDVSQK